MAKIVLSRAQLAAARATATNNIINLSIQMDGTTFRLEIHENEIAAGSALNPHWFYGRFGNYRSQAYQGEVMAFVQVDQVKSSKTFGSQLVYASINDANPKYILPPSAVTAATEKVRSEVVVGKYHQHTRTQNITVYWNTNTGKVQASGTCENGIRYTVIGCRTGVAKGPKTK